jgi:hypothetical protein
MSFVFVAATTGHDRESNNFRTKYDGIDGALESGSILDWEEERA